MILNRENEKPYHLLVIRKDLSEDDVINISHAESFCERVEELFLKKVGMDFYDACNDALMEMSGILSESGRKLNFNAMIPVIYKYWLYREEFESWLHDSEDDEYLLINI